MMGWTSVLCNQLPSSGWRYSPSPGTPTPHRWKPWGKTTGYSIVNFLHRKNKANQHLGLVCIWTEEGMSFVQLKINHYRPFDFSWFFPVSLSPFSQGSTASIGPLWPSKQRVQELISTETWPQPLPEPTQEPPFWIDTCCGLGPAGNKAPCSRLLTPSPGRMGRRKYNERLEGRDQDREGSLTNYGHRQNRLDLGKKKINLICYQSNQSRMMRNRTIS